MNLEPGEALDKLVATKVMQWTEDRIGWKEAGMDQKTYAEIHPWRPSTSIEDAWTVVEEVRNNRRVLELASPETDDVHQLWFAAFPKKTYEDCSPYFWQGAGKGKTAAEAICKAALILVGAIE